jgi:hypothetical protein
MLSGTGAAEKTMERCHACDRHLLFEESACPFCGVASRVRQVASTTWQVAMGGFTAIFLAACYGVAGKYDTGIDDDIDGDGYSGVVDCDDHNAAVHPGGVEVCRNELDDDCDGLTDKEDVEECPGSEDDSGIPDDSGK